MPVDPWLAAELVALGLCTGFLAGMLGAALVSTAGYLISGWGLPSALPGAFGYLYLPALLIVAAASATLAPQGARAAHATDVARLKRYFAIVMFCLAGYMLYRGLSA